MSKEDRSWSPAGRPPDLLEAPPVRLRRWRPEDLGPLERELERSREHLARWLGWARTADRASLNGFLLASQAAFQARTDFGYSVRDAGDVLVGGAGLHARRGAHVLEIGYWIAVDSGGRGFATAAARALTDAALALPDVQRIEIHCDEANARSAAVPRKLGYRLARIEPATAQAAAETGRAMVWTFER